jgi:hypothetical protein
VPNRFIQILFHGVNAGNKAKLNTLSRECLVLGFVEELGQLMCLSAPSEAFIFTMLREEVFSSTAKMLTTVGDGRTVDIYQEVEKPSAWVGIGVRVEEDTSILL